MARAMQCRCCCPPDSPGARPGEPLLDLFPEVFAAQGSFDDVVHLGRGLAGAGDLVPGDDVVVDRHRGERVRLLEHHADGAADVDRVDTRAVEVLAVQ
jgi:hypothetical protein